MDGRSAVNAFDELKVDANKLKEDLLGKFEQCLEKVSAAVNAAKPGRLLADSEEIAREALHEFARATYQKVVQEKITAAEAAFSPSSEPQDRKTM